MRANPDRLLLADGAEIPTALKVYEALKDIEVSTGNYQPFWFGERSSQTEKLIEPVRPSSLPGVETVAIGENKAIGQGIPVKGRPDMDVLGVVLHLAMVS